MRRTYTAALAAVVAAGAWQSLSAQALSLPLYTSPVQQYSRNELGGYLSFPSAGGTAFLGQYRMAAGNTFDIGLTAGVFSPGGGAKSVFALGAEGRFRVVRHNANFPLDGAFTGGIGGEFVSGANVLVIPLGFSVGRELVPQGSTIKITPFAQPTLFILSGNGNSTTDFGLGLGADFKFTPMFGARFSAGIGDIDGVSIGAVWEH